MEAHHYLEINPTQGQVWEIQEGKGPTGRYLILEVLPDAFRRYRIVPLSPLNGPRGEGDVVVHVAGAAGIVHGWLVGTTDPHSLREYVGAIDPAEMREVVDHLDLERHWVINVLNHPGAGCSELRFAREHVLRRTRLAYLESRSLFQIA